MATVVINFVGFFKMRCPAAIAARRYFLRGSELFCTRIGRIIGLNLLLNAYNGSGGYHKLLNGLLGCRPRAEEHCNMFPFLLLSLQGCHFFYLCVIVLTANVR